MVETTEHAPAVRATPATEATRVLFLADSLNIGGRERNIALVCKNIDRSRYLPEVWTLHPGGPFERDVMDSGIRLRCLNKKGKIIPSETLRIARAISKSEATICHAWHLGSSVYAALSKLLFRRPTLLVTSFGFARWPGGLPLVKQIFFQGVVRHFCYAVTANSPSVASYLRTRGVPERSIWMLPNAHDPGPYSSHVNRDLVRRQLGIREGETLVTCVCRLVDFKRVDDLVDAAALLGPLKRRLRILVVGDGPRRGILQEKAKELGLDTVLLFAGVRLDVPEILLSSDLYVHSSELEGLSNSLIEAALSSLPVVACNVPGVTDLFQHGKEAFLVPPRNPNRLAGAIRWMLENPKQAARFGDAARRRVLRDYGIDRNLRRLYGLYSQVQETATMSGRTRNSAHGRTGNAITERTC